MGSSEKLHLIERFTRTADNVLMYRFTVEDPTTAICHVLDKMWFDWKSVQSICDSLRPFPGERMDP